MMKAVSLCVASALYFATALSATAEDSSEFIAKFNEKIETAPNYGDKQKLNFAVPQEGYYSCSWHALGGNPIEIASGETIYRTDYKGFNLYKDGTVKLRRNDKQFDKRVFHWRHNPESGRVVFIDGPLSEYFKWPTHESFWATNRWISMLAMYRPMKNQTDLSHSIICKNQDKLIPIVD
jgi:hypothetical protein